MAYDGFILHGHEYQYDLDWLVKVVKKHSLELSQIDQKIADAVKIELSDERVTEIVMDIISNASGMVNVKIPPNELTPATGNGTANDTDAIQGAINYVHQKGYGAVFFPSGKYLTSGLTLYDNVALIGQDRYSTVLVCAQGSSGFLAGGDASNVSIANLTLDVNQSYQVNDIDAINLEGNNYLLTNLIVKDAFRGIYTVLNSAHMQIDNIVLQQIGESAITIIGGDDVQMNGIYITGISATLGQYAIELSVDNGTYTNINIDSVVPTGLIINGNKNYFRGSIVGAQVDYVDHGNNNTIIIPGVSAKEVYDVQHSETVPTKIITSTELQTNVTQLFVNSIQPIKYSKPQIGRIFNTIPMQDISGGLYNALIESEYIKNIGIKITDVKLWGATGDGVTDDTQAIQNAINYVNSNGTVFVPPGTYIVSKKLILGGDVSFIGSGYHNTVIKLADNSNVSIIGTPLDEYQRYYILIANIGFDGNAKAQTKGSCIELFNVSETKIVNVRCQDPKTHGIYIGGTTSIIPYLESILLRGDQLNTTGDGVRLDPGASDAQLVNVDVGWFKQGNGFWLNWCEASKLVNCQAWQCGTGIKIYQADRCQLSNCLTDLSETWGYLFQECSALQVSNCFAYNSNKGGQSYDDFYILGSEARPVSEVELNGIMAYAQYAPNSALHIGTNVGNVICSNSQFFGNQNQKIVQESTNNILIDSATIYGADPITNIDLTSGNVTLLPYQVTNCLINCYGTPTENRTITMPKNYWVHVFRNSTTVELTITTNAQSITIPAGQSIVVFFNGLQPQTINVLEINTINQNIATMQSQITDLTTRVAALEAKVNT